MRWLVGWLAVLLASAVLTPSLGAPSDSALRIEPHTTAIAGAATIDSRTGRVVTEALSNATTYTLNITNSTIAPASQVYADCWVDVGMMRLTGTASSAGAATLTFAFSAPFTGTAQIIFLVVP
jgi:hypothetical protein